MWPTVSLSTSLFLQPTSFEVSKDGIFQLYLASHLHPGLHVQGQLRSRLGHVSVLSASVAVAIASIKALFRNVRSDGLKGEFLHLKNLQSHTPRSFAKFAFTGHKALLQGIRRRNLDMSNFHFRLWT
jgi:hypothetical protein